MSSEQIIVIIIVLISLLFAIIGIIKYSSEPKKRPAEAKAQERSLTNDHNMQSDKVSAISDTKNNNDGSEEAAHVIKFANEKDVYRVKDKRCPRCNNIMPQFELKCEECGNWLDNEVFQKLNKREISLIKSQGLTITTPSLISLQNVAFIKLVGKELEDFISKTNTHSTSFRVALYFLYCFVDALYLSAHKKSGYKESVRQDIYERMIGSYTATMMNFLPSDSPLLKVSNKEHQEIGVWLFSQLHSIWHGEALSDLSPASMFMVADQIGKIIFPEEYSIPLNIELFSRHIDIFNRFSSSFSKLFIVEDEDFEWTRMIEF